MRGKKTLRRKALRDVTTLALILLTALLIITTLKLALSSTDSINSTHLTMIIASLAITGLLTALQLSANKTKKLTY